METILTSKVVIDQSIYPRIEWSQETVDRYIEALEVGDIFPPIILHTNTMRLLDGMHRLQSRLQTQRETIDVVYMDIPDGVHGKLFAASLSVKHGDRIRKDELKAIAREITSANPDYSLQTISEYTGITRQTIGKWVSDITEHRKIIRKIKALILMKAGMSQRNIGKLLDISDFAVRGDVKVDITSHLTESNFSEAKSDIEEMDVDIDVDKIIEEIQEELIFNTFSDEEKILLAELKDGKTIVLSMRGEHNRLIQWATDKNLYTRIDRRTKWGNPFETPADGDRNTVIKNYAEHYLPHKPSLFDNIDAINGKALGCWCAPLACHGDVLKEWAER